MADLTALDDVAHYWGSDVQPSLTGDLGRVNRSERSRQRVLRRLMTNPGEYVFHPTYGAGLPAQVGRNIDVGKITALIRGQMRLEASVSPTPAPDVAVQLITGGIAVAISYTSLPDRQPVSLSFSLKD